MKKLSRFLVHLRRKGTTLDRSYLSVLRKRCLVCEEAISESPLYLKYRLCPHCRFHYSLTARERIDLLVDKGSFKETNRSIASLFPNAFPDRGSYPTRLSSDQSRTGLTEAAVTGKCTISGHQSVMVVLDFGFMGGSMGSVVGEKVARGFELAAKSEQSLVALVSGGGMRIQEGVLSLMQMAKTVAAANQLREKQVPFIVVLTNPSTGQAYVSFANLADIILAEPGSLIGLAPMRTLKEASKKPVPLDAHTAEAHVSHGLLDNIVDREELRGELATILDVLGPYRSANGKGKKNGRVPATAIGGRVELEQALGIVRHRDRPSSTDYIETIVDNFIELKGDRVSGDDVTIVGGLGYLNGERVVVIGQERRSVPEGQKYHSYPEGFRKARRLVDLAARFKLPVVTLIDTQGAHPGLESEEQGVGNAIATTLSLMAQVPTPVVSVIIGEGGSEAALALGLGDTILMQRYAIFSPISRDRAVSRLYRSASQHVQEAKDTTLTASDCMELGIVDEVVAEPERGAHSDPQQAARALGDAIARQLAVLRGTSTKKLVKNRYKKFRRMGEYTTHSKEAVRTEVSLLQNIVIKEAEETPSKGKRKKAKKS